MFVCWNMQVSITLFAICHLEKPVMDFHGKMKLQQHLLPSTLHLSNLLGVSFIANTAAKLIPKTGIQESCYLSGFFQAPGTRAS